MELPSAAPGAAAKPRGVYRTRTGRRSKCSANSPEPMLASTERGFDLFFDEVF